MSVAFFKSRHGFVMIDEVIEFQENNIVLFADVLGKKYLADKKDIVLGQRYVEKRCVNCRKLFEINSISERCDQCALEMSLEKEDFSE